MSNEGIDFLSDYMLMCSNEHQKDCILLSKSEIELLASSLSVRGKMKFYWVYILLCENSCYYTGYTVDLEKRYAAHLDGTASKYTRSFKPVRIAQSWKIVGEKSRAMKIEKYIKKLPRTLKEKIISNPDLLFLIMK